MTPEQLDRIFGAALKNHGLPDRIGSASLTAGQGAFRDMRKALEANGAAATDKARFRSSIEAELESDITRAELDEKERDAARQALSAAFDDLPAQSEVQTLEWNFLSRVRFDDQGDRN